MKKRPVSPRQIREIAHRDPLIMTIYREWEEGRVSWEDAMMWMVFEQHKICETMSCELTKCFTHGLPPIILDGKVLTPKSNE